MLVVRRTFTLKPNTVCVHKCIIYLRSKLLSPCHFAMLPLRCICTWDKCAGISLHAATDCCDVVTAVRGEGWLLTYTESPRRKGPNFGRVFLRSNYTDITQNTYIQSSMVTEILAREKYGRLWCLLTLVCPWRVQSYALDLQRANPAVPMWCATESVDCVWGANIRFVFVIARQWFG